MKRIALALSAAVAVMIVVGCEENPDKVNAQGITGFKADNAPTQQGKNQGTLKTKPEGMPPGGGGAPGGMGKGNGADKKGGAAFPAQAGPIRPDQIPSDYPRPEGKANLKDGTSVEVKGRDGQEKADGDATPKTDGDKAKAASLTEDEKTNIGKLSDAEQKLAIAQAVCLISGENLGSMGVPVRVEHEGKVAFLCCKGCNAEFKADPAKAMAKLSK